MYDIKSSDLWEALGKIYLKDFEIMRYYKEGGCKNRKTRKNFVSLIKRRLFEDIWRKMQQYNETLPPFLERQDFIRNVCRVAAIKEVDDVEYGRMVVNKDSFIIYINKNLPLAQKRSIIAHELGHTFLYDRNKYPLEPYYRKKSSVDILSARHLGKKDLLYSYDEGFVYEIGRFILVPSYIMEKYIPRISSLDSFIEACKTFKVTKEIMARRLFWDTYDWDLSVNFWKNSFLILYPKNTGNDLPIPKGNKEVFRGYFLKKKSFKIDKIWSKLLPTLFLSFKRPGELITLDELIEYKEMKMKIEMKSTLNRVYVLGTVKNGD